MKQPTPTVQAQRYVVAHLLKNAVKASNYKTIQEAIGKCASGFKSAVSRMATTTKTGHSVVTFLAVDHIMGRRLNQPTGWLLKAAMSVPILDVKECSAYDSPPEPTVIIGQWITAIMLDRGVTHQQLSYAIGSSLADLGSWTAGITNMHMSKFLSIMYALDVTDAEVDDLFHKLENIGFSQFSNTF